MLLAAALKIQYSTPGVAVKVIIALLSAATMLVTVGAGAELPTPPQPCNIMAVMIEMMGKQSLVISIP
jgi:hypothetical protein